MFHQNAHLRAFACAVSTQGTLFHLRPLINLFSLQLPNATSSREPSLIPSSPQLVGVSVAHSSTFALLVLVQLHLNNFWGDFINVSFPLNHKSCTWRRLGTEYRLRKHLLSRCQSHRHSSLYTMPKTPRPSAFSSTENLTGLTASPDVMWGRHAPPAPREPDFDILGGCPRLAWDRGFPTVL